MPSMMKNKLVRIIVIILALLLVAFLARMEIINKILAIGAGIWMMTLTWHIFFGTSEEFEKSLGYSITPDLFSLLSGKLMDDWAYSFMLGFWIFTGVASGYMAYIILNALFIPIS